jgi:hypothetical protein
MGAHSYSASELFCIIPIRNIGIGEPRVPEKVCSFSQTMSKTDATPEKQNRQVAREKSCVSVTTERNLFK